MGLYSQNPDGTWGPAEPSKLELEYDLEVYKSGLWYLYWGDRPVASGKHRTKIFRNIAVFHNVMWDRLTRRFR